jgi:hypothetical protein
MSCGGSSKSHMRRAMSGVLSDANVMGLDGWGWKGWVGYQGEMITRSRCEKRRAGWRVDREMRVDVSMSGFSSSVERRNI